MISRSPRDASPPSLDVFVVLASPSPVTTAICIILQPSSIAHRHRVFAPDRLSRRRSPASRGAVPEVLGQLHRSTSTSLARALPMLASRHALANTAFARAPAPPRAARASARASVRVRAASTIYDFTLKTLGGGARDAPTDGEDLPLSRYKGKVVLINNVATF